jgi:O-acetyl-ADP-ribose deacetylase (regulator of RNase III)
LIQFIEGDLIKSNSDALVNTVNCVGVMGKGIALEFRNEFQENYFEYKKACQLHQVKIGEMFVVPTNNFFCSPKYIINFPTKDHWRNPSRLEWIKLGLEDLKSTILDYKIQSISMPKLGCTNGGLDWNIVKELIVESLSELETVDIKIYDRPRRYL